MTKTKKILVLLLAMEMLRTFAAAPDQPAKTNGAPASRNGSKLSDLFSDAIVAKGKGVEIKRNQLDEEVIRTKAAYAARGTQPPPELDARVLDGLIGSKLILGKATDADKAKAKEVFDTSMATYKKENKITDADFDEKLATQLRMQGITKEDWIKQQIDQATIPVVLEREMKINITDTDVKKFYDENPARFEEPEMVRAAHILLSTRDASGKELPEDKKAAKRKQMEDILKRARGGEDFAKLAKEYSEDPGSKDKGGEYTFPRGQMVPEFEAAAFSMNTNQISDIITTQYGYHIIKLYEKIPAKKAEFDKVAPKIKDMLKGRAIQEKVKDYIDGLKKEAGVEILDEKLK
ncbi:MAG TPA: peptidylprolyl isomerase, partial [Candidatus Eisenbacteria bacterium]|nr:peptidylprolyl isomerase [Candidatus Eisenbacteria bacterium]